MGIALNAPGRHRQTLVAYMHVDDVNVGQLCRVYYEGMVNSKIQDKCVNDMWMTPTAGTIRAEHTLPLCPRHFFFGERSFRRLVLRQKRPTILLRPKVFSSSTDASQCRRCTRCTPFGRRHVPFPNLSLIFSIPHWRQRIRPYLATWV